jgi:hypothetical protein
MGYATLPRWDCEQMGTQPVRDAKIHSFGDGQNRVTRTMSEVDAGSPFARKKAKGGAPQFSGESGWATRRLLRHSDANSPRNTGHAG